MQSVRYYRVFKRIHLSRIRYKVGNVLELTGVGVKIGTNMVKLVLVTLTFLGSTEWILIHFLLSK